MSRSIGYSHAILLAIGLFSILVLRPSFAHATSSEQFFNQEGHIYDDWGIYRTRATGADGFLRVTITGFDPIIAMESLEDNIDGAWQLGVAFARKYPDRSQRAEQIFYFVRDHVKYTSDNEQFGTREFARNADEMVKTIEMHGIAKGDCEDSTILLAILYKAAGFRSAVVLMPGHVATLVYLPEYRKAARKLTLAGEPGWLWAEATGGTNPFGWVPEGLLTGKISGVEVMNSPSENAPGRTSMVHLENKSPTRPKGTWISQTGILGFLGSIGFIWLISGRIPRSRPTTKH